MRSAVSSPLKQQKCWQNPAADIRLLVPSMLFRSGVHALDITSTSFRAKSPMNTALFAPQKTDLSPLPFAFVHLGKAA